MSYQNSSLQKAVLPDLLFTSYDSKTLAWEIWDHYNPHIAFTA